jgi:alanyl-tRNA synthetase
MEAKIIRQKFLEFFKEKGHAILPSAPVIPENDPTVLFTTAGMHPLVPFLLGQPHPLGKRLADAQKCVRTDDIDEVGDETHLTFFEMLGNWSLGDYFKKDAIEWSFEFLTSKKWLGIPVGKLAVSAFEGDANAPKDTEASETWKRLGIPEHKIVFLPKKNNWWGPAGQSGPCGPDTEMFYWVGQGEPPVESNPGNDERNWVEIWNDVFMQYNKTMEGKFEPLKQKNVDTGMGLERVAAVMQGVKSIYETDLFTPILEKIATLTPTPYSDKKDSYRIIADHLRTATFMAADGVLPSNVDQGYVMRRLMRRAIRHGKALNINEDFTAIVAKKVIHIFGEAYPEVSRHEAKILEAFRAEEERFRKTLGHGLQEFGKLAQTITTGTINGIDAFHLYDTYGFPIEMTMELAKEKGLSVDKAGFEAAFQEHQAKSRAGAEQKFKGGLQDHSEETTKLHTATHLLHAALRKILGPNATQKGSNITAERLRFDFGSPDKLTPDQLKQVEQFVNDAIAADVKVVCENMTPDEAKASGVMGLFDAKYGDQVKVYTIEGFSKEICGGPHVEHTGQLKSFKILKEEASSAGIRRIKATVGK